MTACRGFLSVSKIGRLQREILKKSGVCGFCDGKNMGISYPDFYPCYLLLNGRRRPPSTAVFLCNSPSVISTRAKSYRTTEGSSGLGIKTGQHLQALHEVWQLLFMYSYETLKQHRPESGTRPVASVQTLPKARLSLNFSRTGWKFTSVAAIDSATGRATLSRRRR